MESKCPEVISSKASGTGDARVKYPSVCSSPFSGLAEQMTKERQCELYISLFSILFPWKRIGSASYDLSSVSAIWYSNDRCSGRSIPSPSRSILSSQIEINLNRPVAGSRTISVDREIEKNFVSLLVSSLNRVGKDFGWPSSLLKARLTLTDIGSGLTPGRYSSAVNSPFIDRPFM